MRKAKLNKLKACKGNHNNLDDLFTCTSCKMMFKKAWYIRLLNKIRGVK